MRAAGHTTGAIVALLAMANARAQTTYPDCYIQNVDWTSGDHFVVLPQPIYSPGDGGAPASSTGAANTEFVSATQVRLTPGFHAGDLTTGGQFHARINPWMGDPEDLVVITPDASHVQDDILHVEKWEKLEIGYKLTEDYQDAIESFFDNYYSNGTAEPATPGIVDEDHDLDPYADDSLQLVMTLVDPSGDLRMKWGFYMKEAKWSDPNNPLAMLTADPTNPLGPFSVRFRFAPDEEGLWHFALSIKAPYTTTVADAQLPEVFYAGYSFVCDAPLPDNKGPLSVNPNNDRTLWFETTEEPFFGLGVNMGDAHHGEFGKDIHPDTYWFDYYQRDFKVKQESVEQLHGVGGNFMRMYLMRNIFAPEWVNLGVYDAYKTPQVCDQDFPTNCDNSAWTTNYLGNCQYQCWAFDQMLDHARANNVYIQLCIDPYPPVIEYEKFIWGAHPYVQAYLENTPPPPALPPNRYDLKRFFYSNADPNNTQSARLYDEGVFYYWKRKYKYIMSRWGYSVNLPIIEPFNEIDQMLSYKDQNMLPDLSLPCNELDDKPYWGECMENRVDWEVDPDLPTTISNWLTDIAEFVRGEVDPLNPVYSPLGEADKLFLMSYAGGSPTETVYHYPFFNPNVDLIDAHKAPDQNPASLLGYAYNAEEYRTTYTSNGHKKPFHHGEFTSYGNYVFPLPPANPIFEYGGSYRLFDNHDVSFHNELWATAFSSCFAAGTSWAWERVFFWPNSLPYDADHGLPDDEFNQVDPDHSDALDLGDVNILSAGTDGQGFPIYVEVENRTLYHHFKPLSDFLNKPSVQALGLFTGDFSPRMIADANGIECIYMVNAEENLAVGWVHNRNAYWWNSMYITSVHQRYRACPDPGAQEITLSGFETGNDYYTSYFPTRMDATDWPADAEDLDGNGSVTLHLNDPVEAALNGIFPQTGAFVNHLDTLHSDYAFIVATTLVKSLSLPPEDTMPVASEWDFVLYPNPANDEIFVRITDEAPKDIAIFDLSGRRIAYWGSVTGGAQHLPLGELAKGAYWIRVSVGEQGKSKKLLVH